MYRDSLKKANQLFREGDFSGAEIEYRKLLSINDALDAIVLWNLSRIHKINDNRSLVNTHTADVSNQKRLDFKSIKIRVGPTQAIVFILDEASLEAYVSVQYFTNEDDLSIWKISAFDRRRLNNIHIFQVKSESESESKSDLSLILWIIVHLAKLGSLIIPASISDLNRSIVSNGYLSRYLTDRDGFGFVISASPDISSQPVSVSFCIPAGGDSVELRRCVRRILSFDIEKEIIICGNIPDSFPYINQVKIVGRNIPYPPLRLCVKKNVAIDSASFPYICVLHDRVLLPRDFPSLFQDLIPVPVMAIGGLYALGLNYESVGRYSDFNIAKCKMKFPNVEYLSPNSSSSTKAFSRNSRFLFARSHEFSYCCDDVLDEGYAYATGSFFLTHREVYDYARLDPGFYWEDYEDVQWAIRTIDKMIPHVFNTDYFHMTQSVRPTILPPIPVLAKTVDNKIIREFFDIVDISKEEYSKSQNFSRWIDLFFDRLNLFLSNYPDSVYSIEDFKKSMAGGTALFLNNFNKFLGLIAPEAYSEEFVRRLEKLLGITFEVADLEDQKIHSSHFSENFSFSSRLINNWSYRQWSKYFELELINFNLNDFFEDDCKGDFSSIFTRLSNIKRQLNSLNFIFSKKYTSVDWFLIFENFRSK